MFTRRSSVRAGSRDSVVALSFPQDGLLCVCVCVRAEDDGVCAIEFPGRPAVCVCRFTTVRQLCPVLAGGNRPQGWVVPPRPPKDDVYGAGGPSRPSGCHRPPFYQGA